MINAPVGPPICTLLPPRKEMMNPATTAVISPFSGDTPDATAKAIANGSATIPTTIPAKTSDVNCCLLIPPFRMENSLGLNKFFIITSRSCTRPQFGCKQGNVSRNIFRNRCAKVKISLNNYTGKV